MINSEDTIPIFGCSDVLGRLSDFVEGSLSAADVTKVSDHLSGCNRCAQFGDEFQGLLKVVRNRLGLAKPLSGEVQARLMAALASPSKA